MSYALVQEASASIGVGNPSSIPVTLDAPPSAGNLLVVRLLGAPQGAVSSVTDTAGNTYVAAHTPLTETQPEADATLETFYCYPCLTADPLTITATYGGAKGTLRIAVGEWSGCLCTGDPLVDSATAIIDGAEGLPPPYDYSVGTVTPSGVGDLIVMPMMSWQVDVAPPDSAALEDVDGVLVGYAATAASTADYAADLSFDDDPDMFLGAVVVFALVDPAAEVWVNAPDFEDPLINAAHYPSGRAVVRCDLWVADGGSPTPTVQARLVSLLESRDSEGLLEVDAEIGRSAVVQSSVPTDASFVVLLTGHRRYRLQVTSDTRDWDLFVAPDAQVML